jgi:aldehyde:ferredoxin oxidoreductase
MRMFNLREGVTAEDDQLPPRMLGPTTDGALANYKVDTATYDRLKKYYYALMGWDSKGVPLPEKVEDLGI